MNDYDFYQDYLDETGQDENEFSFDEWRDMVRDMEDERQAEMIRDMMRG